MKNTADETGGKLIAVRSQSISGEGAINPFVAFYDIHGRKREVLFFYFVLDTTRDYLCMQGIMLLAIIITTLMFSRQVFFMDRIQI
jgi:hypothetical protein